MSPGWGRFALKLQEEHRTILCLGVEVGLLPSSGRSVGLFYVSGLR